MHLEPGWIFCTAIAIMWAQLWRILSISCDSSLVGRSAKVRCWPPSSSEEEEGGCDDDDDWAVSTAAA